MVWNNENFCSFHNSYFILRIWGSSSPPWSIRRCWSYQWMEFTCNFGFFWKKPSTPHIKILGYDAGLSSQRNKIPLSSQGCRGCPQILADQLTLSQTRGADYAHQIILAPPDFHTFWRPCDGTKTTKLKPNFVFYLITNCIVYFRAQIILHYMTALCL